MLAQILGFADYAWIIPESSLASRPVFLEMKFTRATSCTLQKSCTRLNKIGNNKSLAGLQKAASCGSFMEKVRVSHKRFELFLEWATLQYFRNSGKVNGGPDRHAGS